MSNITLSIEQMKYLNELGLDTSDASMLWVISPNPNPNFAQYSPIIKKLKVLGDYAGDIMGKDEVIPAYTLQDILEKLPQKIKCEEDKIGIATFEMNPMAGGGWNMGYEYSPDGNKIKYLHVERGYILESAYKMLIWCLENKMI